MKDSNPIPEFTLVVGVDVKHLRQLSWTWPTWKKHKPELLSCPMLAFYDREQLSFDQVLRVVDHPHLIVRPWPPEGVRYPGLPGDKWRDPQRAKMLSGFVHVPALHVQTPWWLKLDTDTVATGRGGWIDPAWFDGSPAIVSQPWSYTKPPDQMMKLDEWVYANEKSLPRLADRPPLDLTPAEGADRVKHRRIISWCAFFQTDFSIYCSNAAAVACGRWRLPVPSQDGFLFYVAKRLGLEVNRVDMRRLGWEHWHTERNIRKAVERVMA